MKSQNAIDVSIQQYYWKKINKYRRIILNRLEGRLSVYGGCDGCEPEDLVSTAALEGAKRADKYSVLDQEHFINLMSKIAFHRGVDMHNKRIREIVGIPNDEPDSGNGGEERQGHWFHEKFHPEQPLFEATNDDPCDIVEIRDQIERALREMTPLQRSIFMEYFEGATVAEIAHRRQMSADAVWKNIQRARTAALKSLE